MKTPQNANDTRLLYNKVFVRDKYKKTTRIVCKNPNDDPEQRTICKSRDLFVFYQPPVKKNQTISGNDKAASGRKNAVIGLYTIPLCD